MQQMSVFTSQYKVPGKRMLVGLTWGLFLGLSLEIWITGATGLGLAGCALIGLGVGCCASRRK
jgi:hypothetical protein